MLYRITVFLHVISIFGFLLSHGASVSMAFALRREHDPQKIRSLLNMSSGSYPLMSMTLLASILFGIIASFQGHWWRFGWIWASIFLLIIILVLMYFWGSKIYSAARKAVEGPSESCGSDEDLLEILKKSNPILLTVVGYGGYAIIAWLMMAKPF
jgi:MFS family permease